MSEIKFSFPVEQPYRIVTKHGDKLWYTGSHRGIDIASDQPLYNDVIVRAPASGRLVTKWHYQGGKVIELTSTFGQDTVLSWLAHFKSYLVSSGSFVEKGQAIAIMGNTPGLPWSTGRHTHWHIYINGVVADPLPYVTEQFSMNNAIIRNTKTGSYAFLKDGEKQPLSANSMSYAIATVTMVHGKDDYKNYFSLSDEQYNSYAITYDYFPK